MYDTSSRAGMLIKNLTSLFILFFALVSLPVKAEDVFVIGTAVIPDPNILSPQNSADLNPVYNLGSMSNFPDRGTWAASTSYNLGDRVQFNGVDFIAISSNTSSSSFSTDISSGYWILYSSYTFRGFYTSRFLSLGSYGSSVSWSSSTSFSMGDIATWNGLNFVSMYNHTSSSSFSSDIDNGYWVLRSSCPSHSDYTQAVPSGSTCEDFDAYFQDGQSTFTATSKMAQDNVGGTGMDFAGTLKATVTFDWAAETITPKAEITLTDYPNITGSGTSVTLEDSDWLTWSFHTGNKCGRFKMSYSGNHSLPNSTCYSSTGLFLAMHINFYEKDNKYVPVISFTQSTSTTPENSIRFYNSVFDTGSCFNSIDEHFIPTPAVTMK